MAKQLKNASGKFVTKSDQPRKLRGLRLTDRVWEALRNRADELDMSPADLIEHLGELGYFSKGSLLIPQDEIQDFFG
ncbi:hypothetical protein Cri9333_2753 [Crinalium epipsammum PCC 9333]|uniref:Uncharacterized protein n=1 Tax=Crinalium epipsammum PCC 9333 TaxID=1173022 RepID=K9VZR5_9CYAN|nr:hypothetical protein [Crinalium epipsammum]AFZ13603.1 hypothetical protein Cri9333_2753 [Crinalium epipsammum PCC 9333]